MNQHPFRLLLLAGVCAAATAASAAAAEFSGYGEIFGNAGYTTTGSTLSSFCTGAPCGVSTDHNQADTAIFGGSGHAAIMVDSGYGLQFDIAGQSIGVGGTSQSASRIGMHVFHRNADFSWGGFASVGDALNSRMFTVGLEQQAFFGDLTLESQFSYTNTMQGDLKYYDMATWNAYLGARYFLRDNLALSGGIVGAYGDGASSGTWADSFAMSTPLQWEARGEYLFEQLPISVFAAYRGTFVPYHGRSTYSDGDMDKLKFAVNNHALMIGLRFYFGQTTLRGNDRHGASLEDHNPLYGAQSVPMTSLGSMPTSFL